MRSKYFERAFYYSCNRWSNEIYPSYIPGTNLLSISSAHNKVKFRNKLCSN